MKCSGCEVTADHLINRILTCYLGSGRTSLIQCCEWNLVGPFEKQRQVDCFQSKLLHKGKTYTAALKIAVQFSD